MFLGRVNLSSEKSQNTQANEASASVESAKWAKEVTASDISLDRVKKIDSVPVNVKFIKCDVRKVHEIDNCVNTIVCFNALGLKKRARGY